MTTIEVVDFPALEGKIEGYSEREKGGANLYFMGRREQFAVYVPARVLRPGGYPVGERVKVLFDVGRYGLVARETPEVIAHKG